MNRHTLVFSYDGFMSADILAQGAVHLSCFAQRESHPSHPSTYRSLMFEGVSSIAAQVLSARAVHRACGPEGKGLAKEIEASLNDDFEVELAIAAEERFSTAKSKGKNEADALRNAKAGLIADALWEARSKRGFSSGKGSSSSSGSSVQQLRFNGQGGKALGRFGVGPDKGKGKVTLGAPNGIVRKLFATESESEPEADDWFALVKFGGQGKVTLGARKGNVHTLFATESEPEADDRSESESAHNM